MEGYTVGKQFLYKKSKVYYNCSEIRFFASPSLNKFYFAIDFKDAL